ncbi:MAG: YihA family ribosome biogenesis GTP-binding protein [Oscillospiraceae bacterium]|nr:YihA family ribosome biogenesis GTP-binding protein [Oscillospiraceae bacterium]
MNFNIVEFEASFGTSKQIKPSCCPEFVFVGRSNVGKSSLINKLFNRNKLARVSSMPGKTATINFFKSEAVRFVDLPGYGYAKTSKKEKTRWNELINGYFLGNRNIAIVFLLLDIRNKPSNEDMIMISMLKQMQIPFTIIFTKVDKIAKTKIPDQIKYISSFINMGNVKSLAFSAETGQGVAEIKTLIDKILNKLNKK